MDRENKKHPKNFSKVPRVSAMREMVANNDGGLHLLCKKKPCPVIMVLTLEQG